MHASTRAPTPPFFETSSDLAGSRSTNRERASSVPPSSRPSSTRAMEKAEMVVLPFPAPVAPLGHVKSTLLLASTEALRVAGHFEAYRHHLDTAHREAVLQAIAGTWVPLAAAIAHYRACDALALLPAEQVRLGRQTGNGLRQHLTRAAGLLSRNVGVSPWSIFQHFNRFWARSFDGGGVAVVKHGPKDAEIVYAGCELLESPYFRTALRGVALGLLEAVTHRSFMSELSSTTRRHEARYRFSWV